MALNVWFATSETREQISSKEINGRKGDVLKALSSKI